MVDTQSNFETMDNSLVGLWYQQYSNRGVLYADSIVRSTNDAEEIVQDAFCRLLKCLSNRPIESETRFRATFFTTIRNLCIDLLRRRKRRPTTSLENVAEPTCHQHTESAYEDAKRKVGEAMDVLPDNWAAALRLKVHATLSYCEIAEALDCTQAQVRTWIFRARKRLKEELSKRGMIAPND